MGGGEKSEGGGQGVRNCLDFNTLRSAGITGEIIDYYHNYY